MIVLGINAAFHETAAALVVDGRVAAAVEEERLSRVKHGKKASVEDAATLPLRAIAWVLRAAGVAPRDVDRFAYGFDPRARLAAPRRAPGDAPARGDFGSDEGEAAYVRLIETAPALVAAALDLDPELVARRFRWVPHHLAHAASVFLPSPFERAAVLVVDGIGEAASASIFAGEGARLEPLASIDYPDSVGLVWEKMTAFTGLRPCHDEGLLMSLAPFGDRARFAGAMARVLAVDDERGTFHVASDVLRYRSDGFAPLEDLFGPRRLPHEELRWRGAGGTRDADVAAALQQATESAMLALARRARTLAGASDLCLAGGVAMNCVANGRIARDVGAAGGRLDVTFAPHDAGTALGAALAVAAAEGDGRGRSGVPDRPGAGTTPYLGPRADPAEVDAALARARLPHPGGASRDVAADVARLVRGGALVGLVAGRLEYGPRALGARSILASATDPAVRARLNRDVKKRPAFQPFCPAVLAERAGDWFDLGPAGAAAPASRHMAVAYPTHAAKAARIPAVVHEDGTARIQTVAKDGPPVLRAVLEHLERAGDPPVVLNTSFNGKEPIVCSADDAIATFLATGLDALAIEGYIIEKDTAMRREQGDRP